MSFRNRIKYLLVKSLRISNKDAAKLILNGSVKINDAVITENVLVHDEDEVRVESEIVRKPVEYLYVVFYKPVGIETTLNPEIKNNFLTVFDFPERLFPVGRLDKASEGLLLLTNDGRIMNRVSGGWFDKEKEYVVEVDQLLSEDFLQAMRSGIGILGKITRPAIVNKLEERKFKIVLTEGMNRQIRRMCFKWNYEVLTLKRTRIMNIELGDLASGHYRHLTADEKERLLESVGLVNTLR